MRPRNPVACRITIGALSPLQSSVCSSMPLTVTKLLCGSVFSIISFGILYARDVSLVGFVLASCRLLIDRLCFRRADVFERNRFEQAVAHRTHLCQDEVDARI